MKERIIFHNGVGYLLAFTTFFDSMTAFVNGFSFEGDVLICQDMAKPNPVYLVLLSCRCYVLSG